MSHALKLERWLGQAPGPHRVGQVMIRESGAGYALCHADDAEAEPDALQTVGSLAALREIVKFDEAGGFRPLRGAPTLRRGWRMEELAIGALVEALDVIYPTAVGLWAAQAQFGGMKEFLEGGVPATEFAETARRQTGMYRITQVITEEQLFQIVEKVCRSGCLRRRLWRSAPSATGPGAGLPLSASSVSGELPLLCPEACNYFVAQARERIVADKKEAGE